MSPKYIAVTALAATSITACGSSASSKGLSRAELIAKADAACARSNAKRTTLRQKHGTELGPAVTELGKYEQITVAELGKLVPPDSLADDWKQILIADRTLAGYTLTLGGYISSQNTRGMRLILRSAGEVQRPITALATRDGFADCAQFS